MKNARLVSRHSRLLAIMSRLQLGHGMTLDQLASDAGVCRRTIYRDLALLRSAGIDVYHDVATGRYLLMGNAQLSIVPSMEPDELTALVTAVHLSPLRSLPCFSSWLDQTTWKLLANCPTVVRNRAVRLSTACQVKVPDHTDVDRAGRITQAVMQSISERRVLHITLNDRESGRIQTLFSPYRITATHAAWEVTGMSAAHRRICCLAVNRITQAELTEQPYAIPRHFNVA